MINPHKLPSERDRHAVLGCLAAALGVGLAHRGGIGGRRPPRGRGDDGDDGDDGGDDDGDDDATAALRRTRSFHADLLFASAGFLFLSPDVARADEPYLDAPRMRLGRSERGDDGKEDEDDVEEGNEEDDDAEEKFLLPFLESLSGPEGSFRCVALLVFRFLLSSGGGDHGGHSDHGGGGRETSSERRKEKILSSFAGYDARARTAFKRLAVSVFRYWEMEAHGEFMTREVAHARATRKFQALEDALARRLSYLSRIASSSREGGGEDDANRNKTLLASLTSGRGGATFGLRGVARGLKIGAAGVAAGTLLAVTGGLAAPAVIGGIAALVGASSAVSFVAGVLLVPAATAIFGVGGGTIVARKMSRRTAGLGEFGIERVGGGGGSGGEEEGKKGGDDSADGGPELSRTVFVGGWLGDEHDFERPFGISPRSLDDRRELLCRYCSVHAPRVAPECGNILAEWEGREDELWEMLRATYGRDPSSPPPPPDVVGPRHDALLTTGENDAIDELIRAMGLPASSMRRVDPCSPGGRGGEAAALPPAVDLLSDVLVPKSEGGGPRERIGDSELRSYRAWDFRAEYGGGELYFVRWERELLLELNGSAKEFQMDLAKKAAKEALKKTALASLMVAVAIPSAILSLSNIIDEKWTLAAERSDEAGILLAECLLNSDAGHRPVSLVGFSFGARIILSCLKELARYQAMWERQQESREMNGIEDSSQTKMASFRRSLVSISNREARVEFSREPASIVEDVILMGVPASINRTTWLSCREVVGGRLVNCFSQNDMILALMYRVKNIGSSLLSPPVGISKIDVPGFESYDVSGFVANHGEYCVAVREILKLVGYDQPAYVKCNVSILK